MHSGGSKILHTSLVTVTLSILEAPHVESATVPPTTKRGWARPLWLWLAALLPFVVLAVWRASSGPGLETDDHGQYLMHAQALAEGRSYRDIAYIYSPYARWIGPKAAMPGLPVVLAPVYWLFGGNMIALKAFMLCMAFGLVLIAGLYFARHAGRHLGLGVALLCGLSPAIVDGSARILTDLPFAMLIWAVIYLLDLPGVLNVRRIVAITVLGGFALTFRTIGVVLVPAIVLYALIRYREHRWRPLIPVLVWSSGLLVIGLGFNLSEASVLRVGPDRILNWLHTTGFGLINARWYFQPLVESHLRPFPSEMANTVFHATTVLFMTLGLAAWVRTSYKHFGVLFALVYSVALLVVPARHLRYLWPLYPFFVFGLLNGIQVMARAVFNAPIRARNATVAFAVVLSLLGVRAAVATPRPGDLMKEPDVADVMDFLQTLKAREPVRVTFTKPRALAWTMGIPTMGPIRGSHPCLLDELQRRRISHVIAGNETQRGQKIAQLAMLAASRPDLFTLEHRNDTYSVYRFHASAHVPDPTLKCAPR